MPAEQRGQVIHVRMGSTGNRRNSCLGGSPVGLPWGGTSRMRREFHVRICEGLRVKFPGPTRRTTSVVCLPRSPTKNTRMLSRTLLEKKARNFSGGHFGQISDA